MRTWDMFDTLLGRACGEPWRLFDIIGGEAFRTVRQEAERRSDKTFAGIYSALQKLTGWPQEKIDALAVKELALEHQLAFPIVENVRQVAPGDWIITDTYFNADQVRALANRIGLCAGAGIYASYGGKWSGELWRQWKNEKRGIVSHTGDNRRSDYEMPRMYGYAAVRYSAGDLALHEKVLHKAGHWDVAALSRCVRLQNPYTADNMAYLSWFRQATCNVPFLLLCSARLAQYCQEHNIAHVFFLSRDALLLKKVFCALYPEYSTAVFYASRQCYTQPSPTFLAYAREAAATPRALFVDLQGTGKSAQQFIDEHGLPMQYIFCATPTKLSAYIPSLYKIKRFQTEMEVFNYDVLGRVVDVVGGEPVRAPVEYDLVPVSVAHRAVDCLLPYIFQKPVPATDTIMRFIFDEFRHALKHLVKQHQVHHTP